ncbi:NAD(P)/FAD-dependent oxidoreductase [Streptomyces sp. NPDC093568]|uniref:NAD(P)/FAD-dependent oxidoreductase n=1 Tax=Streptomyces sp. NPDC093568 TaxID=3366041 RepID=UPI003826CA0F
MSRAGGIAVVGASAAGLATVEALRRGGYRGPLSLVGEEPHLPYERPPLSKQVLSGAMPPRDTAMRERGHLRDALSADLRLGVRATGLEPAGASRLLTLETGEVLDCDAVVVATGVRPLVLGGSESIAGVHVLRTLDDALALRKSLLAGGRLVVVGAGVLGTEVAAAGRAAGLPVTMVTAEPEPLASVVGAEVGGLLARVHRAHGVELHTGRTVTEVLTSGGRVTEVSLDNGVRLAADTVVLAMGARPAVEWLAGSGLDVSDGVLCDAMCAAAPGVFAAGDVARWWHPGYGRLLRVEHRMNASEQGIAVARNVLAALGSEGSTAAAYTPVPYFWTDQYGWRMQAFGVPAGADQVEVLRCEADAVDGVPRVLALYGDGLRAVGVVGIGLRPPAVRVLRGLVAGHGSTGVEWHRALDLAAGTHEADW